MRSVQLFALFALASAHGNKGGCHKGNCGGQPLLQAAPIYQMAQPLVQLAPQPQIQLAPPPLRIQQFAPPPLQLAPAPLFPAPLFPAPLQTVAIPQLSTLHTAKPVFHQHGLIRVQMPPRAPIIAPSAITSAQQFAVGTPQLGRVVDRTEPTYFCKKPGFVLEGQVCVSTAVAPPQYICPGGFENAGHACLRRAAILETCPPGYSRRDGHCAKLISSPPVPRCPDGTLENAPGVCIRQIPQPLAPTCQEGVYDGRSGNCIVSVLGESQAFCPEGFQLNDGACLQEEIYDCTTSPVGLRTIPQLGTITTVPLAPPAIQVFQSYGGEGKHGHGHGLKGRMLHHLKQTAAPAVVQTLNSAPQQQVIVQQVQQIQNANTECPDCGPALPPPVIAQANPCAPPPVVVQAEPCEPKVIVQETKTTVSVQKTCTRVTSTALVFACDQGILQGQKCLIKQAVPATPVCTAQGDVNECFTTVPVAPLQECIEGFSRECLPGRPCECVALEAAAFNTSCPVGFDSLDNGCVRSAELRPICPPGFILEADAQQCLRVLREPADCVFSVTYECKNGTGKDCI